MLNKFNLGIYKCGTKEESRFALSSILVQPGRTVATDAHKLIYVTLPDIDVNNYPAVPGVTPTRDFKPFMIQFSSVEKLLKNLPREKHLPILNNVAIGQETDDQDYATLAVTDMDTPTVFKARKGAGQFPNVDLVIPNESARLSRCAFSAQLMYELMQQFTDFLKTDRAKVVYLDYHGNSNQIFMKARNSDTGQEMGAVLMPMRLGEEKEVENESMAFNRINELTATLDSLRARYGFRNPGTIIIDDQEFDETGRIMRIVSNGNGTVKVTLFGSSGAESGLMHECAMQEKDAECLFYDLKNAKKVLGFNLYDIKDPNAETAPVMETTENQEVQVSVEPAIEQDPQPDETIIIPEGEVVAHLDGEDLTPIGVSVSTETEIDEEPLTEDELNGERVSIDDLETLEEFLGSPADLEDKLEELYTFVDNNPVPPTAVDQTTEPHTAPF